MLQYVQEQHSLGTCLPLLEGLLSSCSETSRNLAVVKALRRGENLQVGCRGLRGLGWHCPQMSGVCIRCCACNLDFGP